MLDSSQLQYVRYNAPYHAQGRSSGHGLPAFERDAKSNVIVFVILTCAGNKQP